MKNEVRSCDSILTFFENVDGYDKYEILKSRKVVFLGGVGFGTNQDQGIGRILHRSLEKQNRKNSNTITRAELTRTLRGLGCHLNMAEVDQIMMIASGGITNNIDSNSVGIKSFTKLFEVPKGSTGIL